MTQLVLIDFLSPTLPIFNDNHLIKQVKYLMKKLQEKFIKQQEGFSTWFTNRIILRRGEKLSTNRSSFLPIEYMFDKELVMSQLDTDIQIPECLGWKKDVNFLKRACLTNFKNWAKESIEKYVLDVETWIKIVKMYHWDGFGEELTHEKEFMLMVIRELLFKSQTFMRCSESFKHDEETVRAVYFSHVIKNTYGLADFSTLHVEGDPFEVNHDHEYLNSHHDIVQFLRSDPDFILECVQRFGRILAFLNENYRSNRKYVIEAIQQIDNGTYCFHHGLLYYVSEDLRADRDIVRIAVKYWASCFEYASDDLKSNVEFIRELIPISCGTVLTYANESVRSQIDLLLYGLEFDSSVFDLFSEELQNDREIVLKCARINGEIECPTQFLNDREILKALITNSLHRGASYTDRIYERMDRSLWKDVDFIRELVNLYESHQKCCPFDWMEISNTTEDIIWMVMQQNVRKGLLSYRINPKHDLWNSASFVNKVLELGVELSGLDYSKYDEETKLKIWKGDSYIYRFPFENSCEQIKYEAIRIRPNFIQNLHDPHLLKKIQAESGYVYNFHGSRDELLRLRSFRLEYLQFHLSNRFDTW